MKQNYNYLSFLTLFYTTVILLANWFDPRLVHIFGLDTDAGTIIFPINFLLSDLITEVYGFKNARRAIWYGFLFNLIFILYGQLVIHLPSPSYRTSNADFDKLFSINMRIILASCLSYFFSEPMNSFIMSKMKIKMNGQYLALRFISSTIVASGIDSFIFTLIAFYGIIDNPNLISLLLTMWLIKVVIETVGLPLSVFFVKKLKNIEKMDIYDRHTNFNLFKLDATYLNSENEFKR